MRVYRPPLALTLCVMLCASAALGQVIDVEAEVRRGVALRAQGQDEAALAVFLRSWDLSPSPQARAQMALAEQALGRWVDADAHLREALASPNDPWIRRHRRALADALALIAGHVGRLEVRGGIRGAEVLVEGQRLGTLPLDEALRVPTGTVRLEVRAAGHHRYQREVTIAAGVMAREEVRLVPVDAAAAPATTTATTIAVATPAPVAPVSPTWRALTWASLGGAALFTGSGFSALAAREDRVATYNSAACRPIGRTRERACGAIRDEAEIAETLAVTGFIVGGALAVTSVLLLLVAPSRATPRSALRHVRCDRGPGDLGVTCGASF